MKKKIFLVLICLLVLGWTLTGLYAGQTQVIKVKVQVANVRSEPDANSTVVKQFKMGALLESTQKIGSWFEITVLDDNGNNISAYIHENVVEVVGGEAEPVPARAVQPPPKPASPPPVRTQSYYYGSPGVKVMAGMGLANMTYDFEGSSEIDKYKKSKMGYLGGLGFEMGSRIAFEIDLLYIQKGVVFKGEESGLNFDFKFYTDEISIPVLVKFNFMPGTTPFVVAGGEFAYVMSNKLKYKIDIPSIPYSESGTEDLTKDDFEGYTNRLDYGVVLGGGFELVTGALNLIFELRYHYGLANLSGSEISDDIKKINSSVIAFFAGIKF
jgi:hypothetical protein